MQAEAGYLELLAAAKKYEMVGDTLTLCDADGNESLIFTAVDAPAQ
jgi:hypothetical protein